MHMGSGLGNRYEFRRIKRRLKKDKREVVGVTLMRKESGKSKERKALGKGRARTEGSQGG